jgi:hypothetical protein
LSDYQAARPYLQQEQRYFQQAVAALQPVAQQLAAELRRHAARAQVRRRVGLPRAWLAPSPGVAAQCCVAAW